MEYGMPKQEPMTAAERIWLEEEPEAYVVVDDRAAVRTCDPEKISKLLKLQEQFPEDVRITCVIADVPMDPDKWLREKLGSQRIVRDVR